MQLLHGCAWCLFEALHFCVLLTELLLLHHSFLYRGNRKDQVEFRRD